MRLSLWDKQQLNRSAELFFLRLQRTNPFPATMHGVVTNVDNEVYNTYMSCLPQPIRDAILLIIEDERYIGILETHRSAGLVQNIPDPDDPEGLIPQRVMFDFGGLYPANASYDNNAILDPDHPMQDEITQWIYKAKEVNEAYVRCCRYISNVVEWANTAGQLRTMFPDYVRLLSEEQQRHISKMQKRSSLPKDADMNYLNQHRQFVAEKTALCLLLPEGSEAIWIR